MKTSWALARFVPFSPLLVIVWLWSVEGAVVVAISAGHPFCVCCRLHFLLLACCMQVNLLIGGQAFNISDNRTENSEKGINFFIQAECKPVRWPSPFVLLFVP
jgi:hypothetical protein